MSTKYTTRDLNDYMEIVVNEIVNPKVGKVKGASSSYMNPDESKAYYTGTVHFEAPDYITTEVINRVEKDTKNIFEEYISGLGYRIMLRTGELREDDKEIVDEPEKFRKIRIEIFPVDPNYEIVNNS